MKDQITEMQSLPESQRWRIAKVYPWLADSLSRAEGREADLMAIAGNSEAVKAAIRGIRTLAMIRAQMYGDTTFFLQHAELCAQLRDAVGKGDVADWTRRVLGTIETYAK